MARKTNRSIIDNAINLISSGVGIHDTSIRTGVSKSVLRRAVKNSGIKTPYTIEKERIDNLGKDMVAMYQNGESENTVAKHFSVSRNVVRRQLIRFGVKPRTQGEAETLKWSKMSEEQRKLQTIAAHKATKGTPKREISKIRLANTRERIKYDHLIGPGEIKFVEQLVDRGIDHVHQKAVKFYNVDIAIGNIAVELTNDRGRYTCFNPKEIERAKNLLECGFKTLAVQFDTEDTLIKCTDDIVATVNEMSRLKSGCSQYWVISCRSQDYTITKNKLGQFSSEKSPIKIITKRSVIEL